MDYTKIIPHYTILYYIILYYTIYIILYKYIYIILYIIYTYTYIIILFLEYLGSSSIWNRGIHWSIWWFVFFLRPRSAFVTVTRRMTTWWSTMAGGRLTATESLWLLGDAHDFNISTINGENPWIFMGMGFIRIYDGIPSGYLRVWWKPWKPWPI